MAKSDETLEISRRDVAMIQQIMGRVVQGVSVPDFADAGAEDDGFVTMSPLDNGAGPAPQMGERPTQWRNICWGRKGFELHPQFVEGVLWIESELGLRADFLMACMMFESRLDPKARNPQSTASGLIQFMAQTAIELRTTIEKIRAMDAMTQLSYVYKYFRRFGSQMHDWDLADTYMAILWPKAIGEPADYHLFTRGEAAYKVNAGLDTDKDGFVTKKEAAAKVLKLYEEGLKSPNFGAVRIS